MYNNQNYIYLKKSKNNENIETYFFVIVMDDSNKQKIFLAISNDVVTIFLRIKKNNMNLCAIISRRTDIIKTSKLDHHNQHKILRIIIRKYF